MTTKVEKSMQVDVPVRTAYDQWTQFEEFPAFMGGVREVRQLDDRHLHWVAEIGGVRREWDASVLEQVPDRKIAWAATGGATNAGAVRFEPSGPDSTIVHLEMEYEPEGLVEKAGDALGVVDRQVRADLERFKALVESEGYASGAWRGSINPTIDVGTPGAEAAVGSHGESGKAGVSGKAVAAGAAAAVAGVAAVAAASTRPGGQAGPREEVQQVPVEPPPVPPVQAVVEEPVDPEHGAPAHPAVVIEDDVLLDGGPETPGPGGRS
ncbi:SRPBCC family protein [Trujillonella endophytica]|uniref:Polyketide cyclase / dehydrase and lipid transport n=1 Tax=Trujillonella endophytica TaxID=673521 RepID=A0A1H8PWT8_9ACTN|nr:SRPBCC family protein [Trujillella endophytica]SEO46472.1 Polyketide cyclase / dehydrase and lipid transport [Trujillella endophytica]